MSRKIRSSRASSRASEGTWQIEPAPSRLLGAWHVGVHALAGVSVLASGVVWPLSWLACALLLAHLLLRRPPRPMPLRRDADGSWALPALGLDGLTLRAGSAVGPFWIRLRLGAARSRPTAVLLLPDQLDAETWRGLQAELRGLRRAGTVCARQ